MKANFETAEDGHSAPNTPASRAWSIELTREKILMYAIQYKCGGCLKLDLDTVRACRLVNSEWLQQIHSIFRYKGLPLFYLRLDQHVSRNRILVDQFIEAFTGQVGQLEGDEEEPPFKLVLEHGFFVQSSFDHLLNLLTFCGGALLEMDIRYPDFGGSIKQPLPPGLDLPILQKIRAAFVRNVEFARFGESGSKAGELANLLQPIIQSSPRLKILAVPFAGPLLLNPDCSTVPHLKNLNIRQALPGLDADFVFKLLSSVRFTLQNLAVGCFEEPGPEPSPTFYRFPVMPKLRHFELTTSHWKLDPRIPNGNLGQCLPNLKILRLVYTTLPEFQRWTTGQKMASVETLALGVINPGLTTGDPQFAHGATAKMILSIYQTFPNLKILGITVNSEDSGGIQAIFKLMTGLTFLSVKVRNTNSFAGPPVWDNLLVGTTGPSIRRLTELKTLSLETVRSSPDLRHVSLISELVFTEALLKMPKLMGITFQGRFHVNSATSRQWRSSQAGRTIWMLPREYGNEF